MAIDGKIMNRALTRLSTLRTEREQSTEALRKQIYATIPRIAELDRAIHDLLYMAAGAALQANNEEIINEAAADSVAMQAERTRLLVANGYQSNSIDDDPACSLCDDRGYIGATPCRCLMSIYNDEQRNELSVLLKIGEQSFEEFRLDYYPPEHRSHMEISFNICKSYADKFHPDSDNLYITGEPGLGKTYISCCIAKEVAAKGYSVVYETTIGLCTTLERLKFSRSELEELSDDAERYYQCDLLILDDFGTEMQTGFTFSALYDVINNRLISKRPMIINSNLSPNDLYVEYSPQIASRLTGEYQIIYFRGTDIRKRNY